jgi:hypothetical protein
MTAERILTTALARLQRLEPSQADSFARFFARHEDKLSPIAEGVSRQHERSRGTLTEASAEPMVAQLIGLISRHRPELSQWASTYEGIVLLLVRSAIQGVAEPASLTLSREAMPYVLDLPRTPAERMRTNIAAINLVARGTPPNAEERLILQRYTGNGGLSLEKLAEHVPAELVPKPKALVDEFYTPPGLCLSIASTVAALTGGAGLEGDALEPACGIGRFIGAFASRPDMRLSWTGIEYSELSATICTLLYPFANIQNQPFEQWVTDNFNEAAGKLALVVTNPPYGKRGANKTLDPDRYYRFDVAYQYFILRPFDMLKPGGIGVAVVPGGMLTGNTAALRNFREKLLRRHHLLTAYRLPSDMYPGASIVTDVSFWRARGGELPDVLPDDAPILEGHYFDTFPQHILGQQGKDGRGRLQVVGTFESLPNPAPREECSSCAIQPYLRPLVIAPRPEETLSPELQPAHQLGMRIERYLALAGSAREDDIARAQALHPELLAALDAWLAHMTETRGEYSPRRHPELVRAANELASLATLLSVVTVEGKPTEEFRRPPAYVATYKGPGTIAGHAEWLYAKHRILNLSELAQFRRSLGFTDDHATLESSLAAQGWCIDWTTDGEVWVPESDYYTGDLWPKLDRARRAGGPRAQAQVARLLEYIGVVTMEDAAPTPRDGWVPVELIREFAATEWLKIEVPELHWFRAMIKPVGMDYAQLHSLDDRLSTFLGYINHDMRHFAPKYSKQTDPETGEEETAQAASDRVRLEYVDSVAQRFTAWVNENPDRTARILEAYSRNYRGYRAPEYPPDELRIARWGTAITLKPHQNAGAWRLIRNNGGLLAFDVGVGKTLTGIATLAYLREIGRARRPLIIVPNSIVWKWYREVTRALPDYRVVVIGSVRYLGRDGVFRSRLDEPAERVAKWNEFRLGLYDVALCTYSVYARTGITEESLRRFVEETPPLLRQIGLKASDLQNELDNLADLYTKRSELQKKVDKLEAELAGGATSDPLGGASDGDDGTDTEDGEA